MQSITGRNHLLFKHAPATCACTPSLASSLARSRSQRQREEEREKRENIFELKLMKGQAPLNLTSFYLHVIARGTKHPIQISKANRNREFLLDFYCFPFPVVPGIRSMGPQKRSGS